MTAQAERPPHAAMQLRWAVCEFGIELSVSEAGRALAAAGSPWTVRGRNMTCCGCGRRGQVTVEGPRTMEAPLCLDCLTAG